MSDYISHILAIAIAFLILSLIASSMYDYYVDLTLESQRAEATALSEDINERILDLYSEYKDRDVMPGEGEEETLASVSMEVPESVAGRNYNLRLNSSKDHWVDMEFNATVGVSGVETRRPTARVVVEVTEFPEREYVYPLSNIETNTTGRARNPEEIRLEYIRKLENGTAKDRVEMSRKNP